jgi:hypothetical protein
VHAPSPSTDGFSLSLSPRIGDWEMIKSLIMPFVYAALDSDLGFNLSAPINTS